MSNRPLVVSSWVLGLLLGVAACGGDSEPTAQQVPSAKGGAAASGGGGSSSAGAAGVAGTGEGGSAGGPSTAGWPSGGGEAGASGSSEGGSGGSSGGGAGAPAGAGGATGGGAGGVAGKSGAGGGAGSGGGVPADFCAGAYAKYNGNGAYCGGQLKNGAPKDTLFECKAYKTVSATKCKDGCVEAPEGENDACKVLVPTIIITSTTSSAKESVVRPPLEAAVAYMISRVEGLTGIVPASFPAVTVNYVPGYETYAEGTAYGDSWSTTVWVPAGHAIEGTSSNAVVNISVHEIAHLYATTFFGPPTNRGWPVNEGLATWMVGTYWMNTWGGSPVGSFKAAAKNSVDEGYWKRSMTACVDSNKDPDGLLCVGDKPYKIWASFFEYLEKTGQMTTLVAIAKGDVAPNAYEAGWKAWLDQ